MVGKLQSFIVTLVLPLNDTSKNCSELDGVWPEVHPDVAEAFVSSEKVTELVSTDELPLHRDFELTAELGGNGKGNVLTNPVLCFSWLLLSSTVETGLCPAWAGPFLTQLGTRLLFHA